MIPQCTKIAANSKVAVVGAGVGGLSFAYFLSKLRPDVSITVFEGSNRQGGWINSSTVTDKQSSPIVIEKGPRTLRGVSEGTTLMVDTLRTLHKGNSVYYVESKSEANRKFLLDTTNSLVQVPNSIGTLFKFLRSSLGKGLIPGFLGEPFRKAPTEGAADESAHSLLSRRFGNEYVSNNIFSAIFHGIYAGDIKELSAKRTLGSIVELEKKYGSLIKGMIKRKKPENGSQGAAVLPDALQRYQKNLKRGADDLCQLYTRLQKYPIIGLQGGLETFPKALTVALKENPKVKLSIGTAVTSLNLNDHGYAEIGLEDGGKVEGFEHVRLTNTPKVLSNMVRNHELTRLLRIVHSNTVILVNFYLPDVDLIEGYHSFGYLVPQSNQNKENLLGVIFDSVIEQNLKPLNTTQSESPVENQTKKYTKLTAMLGGHYLNKLKVASAPPNSVYIEQVKQALSRHLSLPYAKFDCGLWQVTAANECLPQSFVNYDQWLAKTERQFAKDYGSHVSLGGMAFSKGPGVPDVVMDGFEDALRLS